MLDGLSVTARLLLTFATQQGFVPEQLATRPPLLQDADEVVGELRSRGLLSPTARAGLHELTPLGWTQLAAVQAAWPELHAELKAGLHQSLAEGLGIGDSPVLRAMESVDRMDFLPGEAKYLADLDMPLPLPWDTNTSAPHAIAALLQAVLPAPGERVLLCGIKAGVTLGWAAAMVGERGFVLGTDPSKELVDHVRTCLKAYPHLRAEVRRTEDVTLGYREAAPFDVIVMNGSVPQVPREVLEQLVPNGGRMLVFLHVPAGDHQLSLLFRRDGAHVLDEKLNRVIFTPLFGRYGWDRV